MDFDDLLDLYSTDNRTVLFKHIENNDLLTFANALEKLRAEIHYKYADDNYLSECLNSLNKLFYKIASSLLPYNNIFSKEVVEQVITRLMQIKKSYPALFTKSVIPLAKSFKQLIENTDNSLYECICDYINGKAEMGLKVGIVTKRAISTDERFLIQNRLASYLKVSYFTDNSYRKVIEFFDEVVFVGNPAYFGDYAKNTFKSKVVTFISYNIFAHSIIPNSIFEDIDKDSVCSTVYDNISIGAPLKKRSNLTLEHEEVLKKSVGKFLEQEKKTLNENPHIAVEASIIYLENNRFLFTSRDSKIRVFSPNEKGDFIKHLNFKDIEEDDYILIRNDRDTKLIAEVADNDVLKENSEKYRSLQIEWKNKLRYNVKRKGIKKVSEILINRYHIRTASVTSLRSWCDEQSICPTELPKILKAFKYDEDKIRVTYRAMKEIQTAHRKAGRIISNKLMRELTNDILKELQEKGYYTFESREFNGASFNIERIVSIDQTGHLISPYNLMKPIKID